MEDLRKEGRLHTEPQTERNRLARLTQRLSLRRLPRRSSQQDGIIDPAQSWGETAPLPRMELPHSSFRQGRQGRCGASLEAEINTHHQEVKHSHSRVQKNVRRGFTARDGAITILDGHAFCIPSCRCAIGISCDNATFARQAH